MKYAYTRVECGPCIMDLLEENDDLSMVHYTSISTEELEQAEVIEDDRAQHYVLFHVETLFAILQTGLTYNTPRTAVMYNCSDSISGQCWKQSLAGS